MANLRPYQTELQKSIFDAWRAGQRSVMAQLITGGGKTVIFVDIIKKIVAANKRVILIAHREELIKQAWNNLYSNGITSGIIKSGINPNYSLPVQVASIQTICRRKQLPAADFVIVDECFVPGTKVDGVDIEMLKPGDVVNAFDERSQTVVKSKVVRVFKNKYTAQLFEISTSDNKIVCTSNHPIFTQRGWIEACKILLTDNILIYGMHHLWRTNSNDKKNMFEAMPKKEYVQNYDENESEALFRTYENKQPYEQIRGKGEDDKLHEGTRVQSKGRKWVSAQCAANHGVQCDTKERCSCSNGIHSQNRSSGENDKSTASLQNRYSSSNNEAGNRDRRGEPQQFKSESSGQEKRNTLNWSRVDSVKVFKFGSVEWSDRMRGENYVYNIEVEHQHTYIANGIVVHNCHHCLDDNTYGRVIDDHYHNARVLGVTATPYRLGGKGFTKIFESLVSGPPFKYLTGAGYLTPLRYFAASIPDLGTIEISNGDYEQSGSFEAMKLAPIVESYREHCMGMCGMCFAVHVEHSKLIMQQYLNAGIRAAHVDANTASEQRSAIFNDLKLRKLNVVVNVGIATEGVDIPNIDFVQLARPTKSLSLYLQMIGRATRPLFEYIKDATSDEERALLLSSSPKPYAIILDNAGLWEDHGLPDQDINWDRYFIGTKKQKKKTDDVIEILTFVAEDKDGRVVRSKNPKEVEGMKLLEITKTVKEKIINSSSVKELDRLCAIYVNLAAMDKPGYNAFHNFMQFCNKNSILVNDDVWNYIKEKLNTSITKKVNAYVASREKDFQIMANNYGGGTVEVDNLRTIMDNHTAAQVKKLKRMYVADSFIESQKINYKKNLKQPTYA